jgi:WD40 repeat protein
MARASRTEWASPTAARVSCLYTIVVKSLTPRHIIDSRELLQRMKQVKALAVHEGCVNTLCWNSKGTCILSGSDDQRLVITDVFQGKVCLYH